MNYSSVFTEYNSKDSQWLKVLITCTYTIKYGVIRWVTKSTSKSLHVT